MTSVSRAPRLTGSDYAALERKARQLHNLIARRTKRNAYVRSKFFKQEKIFISVFWEHLHQKPQKDRRRRLRFYAAAIDLVTNTTETPEVNFNPNGNGELVYRFKGITADGFTFYVQVREDRRTKRKYLMSAFPANKKNLAV